MPKLRNLNLKASFHQILALRLQQLRVDHGKVVGGKLSQAAFATLLGIEKDTFGSYERGDRKPPLSVLVALRRVTGVSLDDLLGD